MLFSNRTIIILFAVWCAALAAALPYPDVSRHSYARLAYRSPDLHVQEFCRKECKQYRPTDIEKCIAECLANPYGLQLWKGQAPSNPGPMKIDDLLNLSRSPSPLDHPASASVQDPEKFRDPCRRWCSGKNLNKLLVPNCIEICMATVVNEAKHAKNWKVDYKPNLDLKVTLPPDHDKSLPRPENAEGFRKNCEASCRKKKQAVLENCIRMCIKGMADKVGLDYELQLVLSMTDWIKLYNEGEQSEAQPSQTQNVRNMKPYKHLLPGNLRQIQPKPSS